MKVYAVIVSDYEDWEITGVFSDFKKAEKLRDNIEKVITHYGGRTILVKGEFTYFSNVDIVDFELNKVSDCYREYL